MIDEEKLAPCPFCGGKAKYRRVGTKYVSCIIECTNCACVLETGETWASGHAWNTRWGVERAITESHS